MLPLIFVLRMLNHEVELVRKKCSSLQYLSIPSYLRRVPGIRALPGWNVRGTLSSARMKEMIEEKAKLHI